MLRDMICRFYESLLLIGGWSVSGSVPLIKVCLHFRDVLGDVRWRLEGFRFPEVLYVASCDSQLLCAAKVKHCKARELTKPSFRLNARACIFLFASDRDEVKFGVCLNGELLLGNCDRLC